MTVLPLSGHCVFWVGWIATGACLLGCATTPNPAVRVSASPRLQPSTLPSVQATAQPTPVVSPVVSALPSTLPAQVMIASPSPQPTSSPSVVPLEMPSTPPQARPSPVAFQTISQIIDLRCSTCHGFNGGVSLRSSEQILQAVPRIQVRVVEQKSMPPGGLPEADRTLIGRWIAEGAKLNP
ncbi:MAG: hypothetical protein IV090_24200 [Candidatus Sericytochromatia bacterium]|nr:hypothetical protein [Candidatus Sericytochromatia bacterium]